MAIKLTDRQMHTRHLAFLREGLLIADTSTAVLIRDILDTCRRFTSTVERWGGDVLPELLMEGASGEQIGELIEEREKAVLETSENFNELLSEFFKVLVDAQNPTAEKDSSAGVSFSRTSRATQILQIQSSRVMARQASFAGVSGRKGLSKEVTDKALDVEASMGRHLEQRELSTHNVVV
jgi:gamma-tubulin complex component 4